MSGAGVSDAGTERDRSAMRRALELAALGLNTTDPNPRVGCVIVQNGRTVGEGWHQWAGEPHAEVFALRAAGSAARGATAYVTLEPCAHHGRTPPCVDALIEAGVRRVVFACRDPNPLVDGSGAERLRAAGIEVEAGVMGAEALELNVGFFRRMRTGLPWVRLKLAMSLDGRTALASGESRWISSEAAREDVQHWRARSSALLTGVGTVLADDPQLNVRLRAERLRQPARVVLDSELRTPPGARLFDAGGEVWIFTGSANRTRRAALEERGARIEYLEPRASATGRLSLERVLRRLGEAGMNEVHVEAGATLAGAILDEQRAQELVLYVAPVLLGPQGRPLAQLRPPPALSAALRFEILTSQQIGPDVRLQLRSAREQHTREQHTCSPESSRT